MDEEVVKQSADVFSWILDHWAFCVFLLTCIIQITPAIKWNPITALVTWIGKQITKDVNAQIVELKTDLDAVKLEQENDEKDRIRFTVLDFANSCRNNRKHTKDEFQHIFALNDKYRKLLEKTGDTNGVFRAEFEYIEELYKECQRNNSFLA